MFDLERKIFISSFILLVLTLLWLGLMIPSMSQIEPDWDSDDYLNWIASHDSFYTLNYINVTLLTAMVMVLFGFLYRLYREPFPDFALTGLLFIPVYGALNLVCYSIQISLVPGLAAVHSSQEWIYQLIQAAPGSLVAFLNGLAYAILGIPSILFGLILHRDNRLWSAGFLELNGICCILGLIGMAAGQSLLALGSFIGGIFFLFALAALMVEFRP